MVEREISAREVMDLIRSGVDGAALMAKFKLTSQAVLQFFTLSIKFLQISRVWAILQEG